MSEDLGALVDEGRQDFHEGLDRLRFSIAGETPHNAYLSALSDNLHNTELDRDQLCGYLAYASLELIDEKRTAERNRLAWQHARQRAADLLAALVASDEERDFLRAQLKERDDEMAALVADLAEYTGITS